MIVVQCATHHEFMALHAALGAPAIERARRRRFFVASKQTQPTVDLVILNGGVGKAFAAASCEFAIAQWAPTFYIDFGAAGALASQVRTGELVVATAIVEHDIHQFEGKVPVLKTAWPREETIDAADAVVHRGSLAAGDRDIDTVEERRELHTSTQALAVCWEAGAIARVCGFHETPFASVRVITDCGEAALLEEYKKGVAEHLPLAAVTLIKLLKQMSPVRR